MRFESFQSLEVVQEFCSSRLHELQHVNFATLWGSNLQHSNVFGQQHLQHFNFSLVHFSNKPFKQNCCCIALLLSSIIISNGINFAFSNIVYRVSLQGISAVCVHFQNSFFVTFLSYELLLSNTKLFGTPCISNAWRKAPLTLKCEASFHALSSRFYAQKLDFDEEPQTKVSFCMNANEAAEKRCMLKGSFLISFFE